MNGVLDKPQAQQLVEQVGLACKNAYPEAIYDVVVSWPGGKSIAHLTNAVPGQMSRSLLVREINSMAVQQKSDFPEIPQDWTRRQATPVYPAPRPVGSVVRIYSRTGNDQSPNFQMVGVIGLLGIDAESAHPILSETVRGGGFLLFSDLPQNGVQD